MATNTSALKTFAQETRKKLIALVGTKIDFILTQDTARLRGYEGQIAKLKEDMAAKGKQLVTEEVAYTWFNRVAALRFMDANGYSDLRVVTPGEGQMRPEILQEAMAGNIDEQLAVQTDDNPHEAVLYRRLLVAVCNHLGQSMPFLFEHISGYTELLLPDDLLSEQSFVADIRRGMSDADCANVEIMGWLYQFYIADRKDDAELKKTRKGGLKSDEQAAATQLFTPHWVVRYMVENSLGRLWMTLHPESPLRADMPYYIDAPEGQTDALPVDIHSAADIRFIDPCMGSGHVLVYAFDLLCKMYEEEGYQPREIPALVLQNNLYGLDIDRRCYQLASFALTMKGRAYHSRYLRRVVSPRVLALQNVDRDTIESAGAWSKDSTIWQFEHVDTIGSLLKISAEDCAAIRVEEGLFGQNHPLLKQQAEMLAGKYHCVVTNPPYLGKGFGDALKNYVAKHFPNSKSDLFAAFIERFSDKVCENGYTAMVTMESWMFLSSYENLRKYLVKEKTFLSLSHFDWHIMRIAFGTVAFVLQNKKYADTKAVFSYLKRTDVDLVNELPYQFPNKENGRYAVTKQSNFSKIPGSPIGYWVSERIRETFTTNLPLSAVCKPTQGLATADNGRFLRSWFEVSQSRIGFGFKDAASAARSEKKWFPYNKGGGFRRWYGISGDENVINWYNDGQELKNYQGAVIRNPNYYFLPGITFPRIGSNLFYSRILNNGFIFDCNGPSCFPEIQNQHEFVLGFMNSVVMQYMLGILCPTVSFQIGDSFRVPFVQANQTNISSLVHHNITLSRADWDAHETSWDFKTNELWRIALGINDDQPEASMKLDEPLHRSLESLVSAYETHWEAQFMQLHQNEEELNRQFIAIYGLEEELTPDVPLSEVTILQKGEISIEEGRIVWHRDAIIKQFISWMVGCFMGRYSANQPGLIIASQGEKLSDLNLPAQTLPIDDDGIFPVVMEPDFFDDDLAQRVEAGRRALFGAEHYYENMKFIKECLGQELRDYLFKDFYADHIDGKMYQKRPIYWLISSKMGNKKKRGYFRALLYMHRLESDTLAKLHADYVAPYIDKIEQQRQEADDNAVRDDLSASQRNKAQKLAAELTDKVRELKEFATTLAEMSTQRLTIDLDDGVRANYPKYYPLVEPIKGLEGKE